MSVLATAADEGPAAQLYPHQLVGVGFLAERRSAVLADEVGLGKTVQALTAAEALRTSGHLKDRRERKLPILISTDNSLVTQWADEARKFMPHWRVATGDDVEKVRTGASAAVSHGQIDALVLNHESVRRRADWLSQVRPALVIVDEASALKGAGEHWKHLRGVTNEAIYRWALTATPYETDPLELWAILQLVHAAGVPGKQVFGRRFVEWRTVPVGYGRTEQQPVGLAPGTGQALRQLIAPHLLRRTAEEVGLPLPAVEREEHPVRLTDAQAYAYSAASNRRGLSGHQAREKAGRVIDGESALALAAVTWLLAAEPKKAVMWARNFDQLDVAEELLDEAGFPYVRLDGRTGNRAQRTGVLEAFRSDAPSAPQVLLASDVLERGLNLQHCDTLVSLGRSWNPADEAQREGRLRRIGSPFPVVHHVRFVPATSQADTQRERLERRQRDFATLFAPH
jgi:SNF2 family DNA or RNA helicase